MEIMGSKERMKEGIALLGGSLPIWMHKHCTHWGAERGDDGTLYFIAHGVEGYDFRMPNTPARAVHWLNHLAGKQWVTDASLGELTRVFLILGLLGRGAE